MEDNEMNVATILMIAEIEMEAAATAVHRLASAVA
jgi:hypothetical protein